MNFDYAALERRISSLESAQTASLRFGRVTGVSGGKARVELADGQNVNSYELSTIQNRVLRDQDIKMPDIGEPVACLFSGQGCEQGLVLGAYYNGQESDPGLPEHKLATLLRRQFPGHSPLREIKALQNLLHNGEVLRLFVGRDILRRMDYSWNQLTRMDSGPLSASVNLD